MSESKHTPGPWSVVVDERLLDEWITVRAEELDRVATIPADDTREVEDGAIMECLSRTAKANAHLIAAAPEMLEALRQALPMLQQLRLPGPTMSGAWTPPRDVIAAVRAAIAKATGGEP